MKTFKHPSHTARELMTFDTGSAFKPSIVYISVNHHNGKLRNTLRITRNGKRLLITAICPFFVFQKDNTAIRIGGHYHYLWYTGVGWTKKIVKNLIAA